MRASIAIVLSALLLLTGAMGSFLNVMNKCNFPVYCLGARSDPPLGELKPRDTATVDESDIFKVPLLPSTLFPRVLLGSPLWRPEM